VLRLSLLLVRVRGLVTLRHTDPLLSGRTTCNPSKDTSCKSRTGADATNRHAAPQT